MGQITSQLGQLFVQSIPTVVFVLFLWAFLDRLFFKPLSQTLDTRAKATIGVLAEARRRSEAAEEKLREYEGAIQSARQEIYHRRDEARRKALSERDSKIHAARGRADAMVSDAQAELDRETTMAKTELLAAVEALATEVTVSLFAPHLSPGGQGGVQA